MARLLLHPMSLIFLLLLAALGASAATTEDTPAAAKKQVGTRIRYADKEETQWLDRFTKTHQPLGAGPLRLVRATPEEEYWLNRLSRDDDVAATESHSHAGEDGGGGGYIDFDDDNPYIDALRDWVFRLKAAAQTAEDL